MFHGYSNISYEKWNAWNIGIYRCLTGQLERVMLIVFNTNFGASIWKNATKRIDVCSGDIYACKTGGSLLSGMSVWVGLSKMPFWHLFQFLFSILSGNHWELFCPPCRVKTFLWNTSAKLFFSNGKRPNLQDLWQKISFDQCSTKIVWPWFTMPSCPIQFLNSHMACSVQWCCFPQSIIQ